jgi:hypothetical protein
MRMPRLTALYLLGLSLLGGAVASTASAKTQALALYEAGRPLPSGAKLDVVIHGFCPRSDGEKVEHELWIFPARVSANRTSPVVVSVEPPGKQYCYSTGALYSDFSSAELTEIQLKPAHKVSITGVFRFHPGCPTSSECGHCIWESHNGAGNISVPPGEATISAIIYGRGTRGQECYGEGRSGRVQITGLLRGSNGTVLEVRGA